MDTCRRWILRLRWDSSSTRSATMVSVIGGSRYAGALAAIAPLARGKQSFAASEPERYSGSVAGALSTARVPRRPLPQHDNTQCQRPGDPDHRRLRSWWWAFRGIRARPADHVAARSRGRSPGNMTAPSRRTRSPSRRPQAQVSNPPALRRSRLGFDTQLYFDIPVIGGLALKSEGVIAWYHQRGGGLTDPIPASTDVCRSHFHGVSRT